MSTRRHFIARTATPAGASAKRQLGSDAKAKEFVANPYGSVPILDTGARGSTVSFAQRHHGDVLIAWQNDAHAAVPPPCAWRERMQRILCVTAQDWGVQLPSPRAVARKAPLGYVPERVRNRRQQQRLAWAW